MSDTQLSYVPQSEGHISPFGMAVDAMHVTATAADDALFGEMNGWYAVRVAGDGPVTPSGPTTPRWLRR